MSRRHSAFLLLIGAFIGAGLATMFFLIWIPEDPKPPLSARETDKDTSLVDEPMDAFATEWQEQLPKRNLKGDCTLSGAVFTADGTPIEGAVVRLRLMDEPWPSGNVPLQVSTDKDGNYTFADMTRNAEYLVYAFAGERAVGSHERAICGAKSDLYLDRGAVLSLRFVDEDGNPVPSPVATLAGSSIWPQREAMASEDGELEFAGLEPGFYTFMARRGSLGFTLMEPLELSEGDEVELEAQMRPIPPGTLRVINGADQSPVSGAVVSLTPKNASLLRQVSRTDKTGTVRFNGISVAGNDVEVWAPGHATPPAVTLMPGGTVTVTMETGSSVQGIVVDPTGHPIEGATVQASEILGAAVTALTGGLEQSFLTVMLAAENAGWPRGIPIDDGITLAGPSRIPLPTGEARVKSNDSAWSPTTEDGGFLVDGLAAGEIHLGATHPRFFLLKSVPVEVTPNTVHENIRIVMIPGVQAALRILDRSGYPIRKAEVSIYDEDGEILATGLSEPDGYVRFDGLPGQFRAGAVAEGYVPASTKMTGKPGQEVETALHLLPADKILRGRVVDKNGFGIGNAILRAKSITRGLPQTLVGTSEADGTFSLEGAGEGTYHVEVEIDGEVQVRLGTASHKSELQLVVNRDHKGMSAPNGPSAMVESLPSYGSEDSGDNLGMVAVTHGLREPDNPNTLPLTEGSVTTAYGPADQLMVTGPPAGKGGLPIGIGGGPGAVKITSVQGGSAVAAAGLKPGARLLKVDGIKVNGPAQATKAIAGPIGSVVMLEVLEDGESMSIVVQRVRVK